MSHSLPRNKSCPDSLLVDGSVPKLSAVAKRWQTADRAELLLKTL